MNTAESDMDQTKRLTVNNSDTRSGEIFYQQTTAQSATPQVNF